MRSEVQSSLHSNEHGAITCRRADPRMSSCTRNLDVCAPRAGNDFSRDRLGERTPAGIAAADKEDVHRLSCHRSHRGPPREVLPLELHRDELRVAAFRYNRLRLKVPTVAADRHRAHEATLE